MTKHLRVLAAAGLIDGRREGREHVWAVKPARLAEVQRSLDLIARGWDDALVQLKARLEKDEGPGPAEATLRACRTWSGSRHANLRPLPRVLGGDRWRQKVCSSQNSRNPIVKWLVPKALPLILRLATVAQGPAADLLRGAAPAPGSRVQLPGCPRRE